MKVWLEGVAGHLKETSGEEHVEAGASWGPWRGERALSSL